MHTSTQPPHSRELVPYHFGLYPLKYRTIFSGNVDANSGWKSLPISLPLFFSHETSFPTPSLETAPSVYPLDSVASQHLHAVPRINKYYKQYIKRARHGITASWLGSEIRPVVSLVRSLCGLHVTHSYVYILCWYNHATMTSRANPSAVTFTNPVVNSLMYLGVFVSESVWWPDWRFESHWKSYWALAKDDFSATIRSPMRWSPSPIHGTHSPVLWNHYFCSFHRLFS